MAKERLFDLPQTRGSFQLRGKVMGVEKDNFYTEKKTRNGNDFRMVNFGVTYDNNATVFVGINGMPRDKVYFSKRNPDTKKTETKAVNWNQRENFKEDGWNLIGVSCGIEQKRNEKGGIDNIVKSMTEYDAAQYLSAYLEDDMDIFATGNIEFNSFTNKNGEVTCGINYRPNRIYACKAPIDFEADGYEPQHDFKQTIVFREIEQEKENDKATGRFIVSAWIVNYASIENANFIIEDKGLANLFKKNLKSHTAISVWGRIDCRTIVEEVTDSDDCWGVADPTKRISRPVVREMVITGADPASRDTETYTEKEMDKAFEAIRKSKNAEENFNAGDNSDTDSWGSVSNFDDDEDTPW